MKYILIFLPVFACAVSAYSQAEKSGIIRNVSVKQFRNTMDSLQHEIIIDLRTPEELTHGKIPGAIVIDFFGNDFERAIAALDKNKVYLLYCASGGRSGETADLMHNMGFKDLYNLESGFRGWVKEKMPVGKQ